MDGVGTADDGGGDNSGDVQVGFGGGRRTNTDCFVGEPDVEAVFIGFGVDGDGFDAHFAAGANDAECNFSAVGNQDLSEHGYSFVGQLQRAVCCRVGALCGEGLNDEEGLPKFYGGTVFYQDLDDFAVHFGFNFVEDFHGFNEAECLAFFDGVADLDKRWFIGCGSSVEGADHR